jgi:hypothetical protein
MQSTCAVCDQGFTEDGNTIDKGLPAEIYTLCYGAKYCSVECKEGNAWVTSPERGFSGNY